MVACDRHRRIVQLTRIGDTLALAHSPMTALTKLELPAETARLFQKLEIYTVEDFLAVAMSESQAAHLLEVLEWTRDELAVRVREAKRQVPVVPRRRANSGVL